MPSKPLNCADICEMYKFHFDVEVYCCCECRSGVCRKKGQIPKEGWNYLICCGVWDELMLKLKNIRNLSYYEKLGK